MVPVVKTISHNDDECIELKLNKPDKENCKTIR